MREVRFLIKTDEELNLLKIALGLMKLRFKNANENAAYFMEGIEKLKQRVDNAVDRYWAECVIHEDVLEEAYDSI